MIAGFDYMNTLVIIKIYRMPDVAFDTVMETIEQGKESGCYNFTGD